MPRRPNTVTMSEVARNIRAMQAEGLPIVRVVVRKTACRSRPWNRPKRRLLSMSPNERRLCFERSPRQEPSPPTLYTSCGCCSDGRRQR